MAKLSPEQRAHLEWLGYVQPTGLVVSPMALATHGAIVHRNDRESQRKLLAVVPDETLEEGASTGPHLPVFRTFTQKVLGWTWTEKFYVGTPDAPLPDELKLRLEDYEETLAPHYAVRDRDPADEGAPWQLLVHVIDHAQDLDAPVKSQPGATYEASPHDRMERLLRGTGAPAGLISNGETLRLISAPRGESSGWIDFHVADMVQTAGRLVCAALEMLLGQARLLAVPRGQRFTDLLRESRKYQNAVSEKLAEQVLHALYELLRGLESADAKAEGRLLEHVRHEEPDQVYHALLNVLLRMVFLLYAEERGMLPKDGAFLQHYSLVGLHRRLTEDAAQFPDTMDARFGAWAQLVVLFRMVHDGAQSGELQIPARHGVLFDPDRYPFLEGRSGVGVRQVDERLEYPRIPDGAIQRVLEKLLVLDGERLSYRALDVEQIGSVYETMMGFRIETATGTSIAIKAQKKGGAPTTIDLDALLEVEGKKRAKWVQDHADRKLTKTVTDPLKAATTIEELHASLDKVLDKAATPDLVPKGSLVLQPSEARRKSGSHYTPRELTEPIVRTTLRPILERLREEAAGPPTPDQILDLKVCDPAMGSGAFLVEACRQLGDAVIEAWAAHDARPQIPSDEDEVIHARRLVAQRCLYGVDRNPVAVNLAKVSLWLTTLAKDHAFTFVDHALRHGDSLVGLTNAQIAARDWSNEEPLDSPRYRQLKAKIDEVVALRRQIREAGDETSDWELRDLLDEAEHRASEVRTWGDLVIEAFFSADKDRARKQALSDVAKQIAEGVDSGERARLDELRREDPPLAPFHWELEFPEVFDRERPGFDAFVGNPPFKGGKQIAGALGPQYGVFLKSITPSSKGAADLVAFFLRGCFDRLRQYGCLGFIATKSIRETATCKVGLEQVVRLGGQLYAARSPFEWVGDASVIVVSFALGKGTSVSPLVLDGVSVSSINPALQEGVDLSAKARLKGTVRYSQGTTLFGDAFVLDSDEVGDALRLNPGLSKYLRRFVNGDVLNETPAQDDGRRVLDFGEREQEAIEGCDSILSSISARVLEERSGQTRQVHETRPWLHWDKRTEFYREARKLSRILAVVIVSRQFSFCFVSPEALFTHGLKLFASDDEAVFASLQSRVHESWARATSSYLGRSLRYSTSTSFDTFPLPPSGRVADLAPIGAQYHDERCRALAELGVGLTELYGRFHDPDEDDTKIVQLRELHTAMDRAVLDAYGWTDIPTDCEFLLDYEDEDDDGSSRRKKPWRYRWPDEVRDEVLARLLELNAQRAAEERGETTSGKGELFPA